MGPSTNDLREELRAQLRDRYELGELLGEGGNGAVFAAVGRDGARVAIKVLKPGNVDEVTRARHRREVEALAKLRSPQTVRLLAHGNTASGLPYLVLEHVEGESLAAVLARGRLSPTQALAVLRQLLDPLEEAHGVRLLHRDLKPENVMVLNPSEAALRVRLLDFGIVRALGSTEPNLTQTGELIGTPRYMSPEQLTGRELTPASDIYSLGLVAFEMLQGRDSLQGNSWGAQLERLRTGHLFSIDELPGANVLWEVVPKMAARKVADRYASAAEVRAALDGVPAERSPRVGVLGLAALAAVLVVGLVVALDSDRAAPTPGIPSRLLEVPAAVTPPVTQNASVESKPEFLGLRVEGLLEGADVRVRWSTYVPQSYTAERGHPLVLLYHGTHQDPHLFVSYSGFPELADEHGFIVVAPHDTRAWWHIAEEALEVRELQRDETLEIVEDVARRFNVDRKRVYAVSHAEGGQMVDRLSCEPWLAAIAFNSHTRGTPFSTCVSTPRTPPTLMLLPLHSGHEPYTGARGCEEDDEIHWNTREMADVLGRLSGCDETAAPDEVLRVNESVCDDWRCEVPFGVCLLDGGRPWPGQPRRVQRRDVHCDGEAPKFPTAKTIWAFLSEHALE